MSAEVPAEGDAVDVAAEHHVEDGDVVREPGAERVECLLAAQGDVDRDAGLRQPASEASGNLGFVLDDEYAHAGIVCSGSAPHAASRVTRYLVG